MAGYVTSSRLSQPVTPRWSYRSETGEVKAVQDGDWHSPQSGMVLPQPVQTTYSYRSGSRESTRAAQMEASNVRTWGAAMQHFRSTDASARAKHDTGHVFWTTREWLHLTHPGVVLRSLDGLRTYNGPIWPVAGGYAPGIVADFVPLSLPADLDWYGTKAISQTAPTNPHSQLTQSLIELKREGLPKLLGAQAARKSELLTKKVGGEHLNWQFGVKPLARDIADIALVISQRDRLVRQYLRDAGNTVRRTMSFPEEHAETSVIRSPYGQMGWRAAGTSLVGMGLPTSSSYGSLVQTTTASRRIWFSGAFTYQVDPSIVTKIDSDKSQSFRQLQRALGSDLSPDVIWNLTPWSWLVDWFGNFGDVISAVSRLSEDGLVLRYGYIMCHQKVVRTHTVTGLPRPGGGVWPPFSASYVSERKDRVRATPYGFGLNPGSFTNRQWAILGSLGMTRDPRQLRHD